MNAAAIASIGIDLGKTTFHFVALDCHAGVILRKKFSRSQLREPALVLGRHGSLLGFTLSRG